MQERYDENTLSYLVSTGRFDANEGLFMAKELEKIKTKSYDVLYPEFTATKNIPVSNDAGIGAETITYFQYDSVGVAKIISNYGTDTPRIDLVGKKFTSDIKGVADSYGYSIQDVRAARMAGKPLEQRKANAARKAIDQEINRIAYFGDAANGLNGLFTHPNITTYVLPQDGTLNGVTASTAAAAKFVNKTPDQIIRDLNGMVDGIVSLTKGVERPDTLLIPHKEYGDLVSRPRSTTSDTTILAFFLANNPYIKNVEVVPEAQGAGTTIVGSDLMIMYKKDPDKLTLEIPQMFEQFPPQLEGLETVVICHARCGGVIIYYPLSIIKAEGI